MTAQFIIRLIHVLFLFSYFYDHFTIIIILFIDVVYQKRYPVLTTLYTNEECQRRGNWVWTTCPESLRSLARPGIELATSWSQVRRPIIAPPRIHHAPWCINLWDLPFIPLSLLRDLACVVLIGQLLCALIGASRSAFDAESVRHCSAILQQYSQIIFTDPWAVPFSKRYVWWRAQRYCHKVNCNCEKSLD